MATAAIIEAKKTSKLSAGEFLFGPKKPKLKSSSAQLRSDEKKHKRKHAKSLPGRLQKGYKMVFGKKVKVSEAEARLEWQGRFANAFATAHLFEDLSGALFEQALIEDGGEVTPELLEDVFVGLLTHAGIDDVGSIDEAIDELVEELWLERMERTKAFAKKAAGKAGSAAKKHGKGIAKDVGKSLLKHAAGEVEKHLKGVKTKKGSAKDVLKHAARGALKQIAKDPKKTKEIVKKSATKLAKKGAKGAIKKGLKMVFGKWAKTEDVEDLDEAMAKGKTSFDVPPPNFRSPDGGDDKYAEAERVVSFIRMKHPEFKDIYWDTWTSGKSVWIGLRDNRDVTEHSKRLENLFKLIKKMGWTSRRNKSDGRTSSLIARPKASKKPSTAPAGVKMSFDREGKVAILKEPDGSFMAMTRAHSKNFKTYEGALAWLHKNASGVMGRFANKDAPSTPETKPKTLKMQGVKGHVLVDLGQSELRPALPVSVAAGLQGGAALKPDHLAMRQEWEHLATQQLGAPPARVWTWVVGNKRTEGGPGKIKPTWRGVREWLEVLADGVTLHESLAGALVEWEASVDDDGYAWDDEGNKWFVGKQYAGGTYGLGQLPMGGEESRWEKRNRKDADSGWNKTRMDAIEKAIKSRPDKFLSSVLKQLGQRGSLSAKQASVVVKILERRGSYDAAKLFGGKGGAATDSGAVKISIEAYIKALEDYAKKSGNGFDALLANLKDPSWARGINSPSYIQSSFQKVGMEKEAALFSIGASRQLNKLIQKRYSEWFKKDRAASQNEPGIVVSKRTAMLDKALKKQPNNRFLKSMHGEMVRGRGLTRKQEWTVGKILQELGMYDEAEAFGAPSIPKSKRTAAPSKAAEPKQKISTKNKKERVDILDKALGQKPDSFLKGMKAMIDKGQPLTVDQAKKVRYHLHRLGMHAQSKLFKEGLDDEGNLTESTSREALVFKARDKQWYWTVADDEYGDIDAGSDSSWGPFGNENAAMDWFHKGFPHSNPGGFAIDNTGKRPKPKRLKQMRAQRWGMY